MISTDGTSSRRVLDPIERISEVLFGLIMAMTFTGTLSVVGYGRPEVRTMLVGALGCNLAWGLVDAIMYLMGSLADRAAGRRTLNAVQKARTAEEAKAAIRDNLPPLIASVLAPAELDRLHAALSRLQVPGERLGLKRDDWLGALAVFLLVFLSTIPIVIPFMLVEDARIALRISNGIAAGMMLLAGYAYGRLTGYKPWVVGGSMVLVGCILVAMIMALGG